MASSICDLDRDIARGVSSNGMDMTSLQIEKARYWLLVARVAAIWMFVVVGALALYFRS